MLSAMEVKSDEQRVHLFILDEVLMLEVFVSGIYKSDCLRNFGTSVQGLTRKLLLEHEHVAWEMGNRGALCFDFLCFQPSQLLFVDVGEY